MMTLCLLFFFSFFTYYAIRQFLLYQPIMLKIMLINFMKKMMTCVPSKLINIV